MNERAVADPLERRVRVHEWLLVAGAVGVFLLLAVTSSRVKCPAADAMAHYEFGRRILGKPWASGERHFWDGTMPVTALHVLSARARVALTPMLGPPRDAFESPEDGVVPSLLWARIPSMLVGALLLIIIWAAARRLFGPGAAAAAVVIGALEPGMIGHARFIATDLPAALAFLLGCLALLRYLKRPDWPRLVVLAAVLAVAQLTKTSCLLLYGIAGLMIVAARTRDVWRRLRATPRPGLKAVVATEARAAAAIATTFVFAFLVVVNAAFLAFDPVRDDYLARHPRSRAVLERLGRDALALRGVVPLTYAYTVVIGRMHNKRGHPAYLLGEFSRTGWPHYFLVALAVKTPLAILLLALLALIAVARDRRARRNLLGLAVPALLWLAAFSLLLRVNIGVRHMLPIYPALIIAAGVGLVFLVRLARAAPVPRAVSVCIALIVPGWLGWQTAAIHPHHAQYFSVVVGGANEGWRYLLDSNLDWNQDGVQMRDWAAAQDPPAAVNPVAPVTGLVVIQATDLIGQDTAGAARAAWLRDGYYPLARPTPAVWIYDVGPETAVSGGGRGPHPVRLTERAALRLAPSSCE